MTNPTMAHPAHPIPIRRLALEFSGNERFWLHQNAILTCFVSGLSAGFPTVESLFIRVVRERAAGLTQDPALQADVRGFIGQEAQHSKQHIAMNRWLGELGYPIGALEDNAAAQFRGLTERLSADDLLAITAAFEHFTAVVAECFLTRPELFEGCPEGARVVLMWHALEEIEHKTVCFDVYQRAVGSTWRRRKAMLLASVAFGSAMTGALVTQLRAQRYMPSVREWLEAGRFFLGRRGMVWGVVGAAFAFLRADFHPLDHDTSELVGDWRLQLPEVAAHTVRVG